MPPTPKEKELHRIAVTGIIWKKEDGVYKYLITKRSPHKKAARQMDGSGRWDGSR